MNSLIPAEKLTILYDVLEHRPSVEDILKACRDFSPEEMMEAFTKINLAHLEVEGLTAKKGNTRVHALDLLLKRQMSEKPRLDLKGSVNITIVNKLPRKKGRNVIDVK